jgi:ketosteroid isomerase-like protein
MTPEARLQALADRQAIADVLARFCERVDEYQIDAAAELFTPDCLVDYGPGRGGEQKGREALRNRLAQGQGQFRRTHHQIGQVRVELDGDEAAAVTYVTAWDELWDGRRETARLQYRDRLRRSPNGWLISERRTLATGIEGFEGVPWNWVPRAEPRPEDRIR